MLHFKVHVTTSMANLKSGLDDGVWRNKPDAEPEGDAGKFLVAVPLQLHREGVGTLQDKQHSRKSNQ
jgi:hypothetical protein